MTPEQVALAMGETLLAPGVTGYSMDVDGALYLPVISALSPGNGDVGRYLDSLRNRTVKVPCVLNPRLLGMLQRRGFHMIVEHSAEFDEDVEVWIREAEPAQ